MRSRFARLLLVLGLAVATMPLGLYGQQGVSFVALLVTPEKYDGKKVRVTGFLHNQFEDSALYLHKDDADYLTSEHAIWITYGEKRVLEPLCKKTFAAFGSKISYFDGRYVEIEGTFNMKGRGHLGAFSGTIEDVSRVYEARQWFDGSRKVATMDQDGRILNDCK